MSGHDALIREWAPGEATTDADAIFLRLTADNLARSLSALRERLHIVSTLTRFGLHLERVLFRKSNRKCERNRTGADCTFPPSGPQGDGCEHHADHH
jgi:hypothetical protein